MTQPLAIVGAGGFGRETIDLVRAINSVADTPPWDLLGVVDDSPVEANLQRLSALGVPFLGTIDVLADAARGTSVAIGVGAPAAREAIAVRIDAWGLETPDLRHPSAVFGSAFQSKGGLVVCAHVSVGTNVTLGRHVHLNPHAVIGHDTELADFVSVNPNATVSGDCRVGDKTLVGAGSVILQGLDVGADVVVGASACVSRNVTDGRTVKGVPAR